MWCSLLYIFQEFELSCNHNSYTSYNVFNFSYKIYHYEFSAKNAEKLCYWKCNNNNNETSFLNQSGVCFKTNKDIVVSSMAVSVSICEHPVLRVGVNVNESFHVRNWCNMVSERLNFDLNYIDRLKQPYKYY